MRTMFLSVGERGAVAQGATRVCVVSTVVEVWNIDEKARARVDLCADWGGTRRVR